MKAIAVCAVVITLFARSHVARAEACTEEAATLRAHLEVEAHRARRWNTAWIVGYSALTAGQLALVLTETSPGGTFDQDAKESTYVGAIKSALGATARIVTPLRIAVPASLAGDPCNDVVVLRAALADAGRAERKTFWGGTIGGLAMNLAGAGILTYRRSFEVGAISFASGYVIALLAVYTQPRRSWHAWRERRVSWTAGVAGGDAWSVWVAGRF
jgi:hypothetical protein